MSTDQMLECPDPNLPTTIDPITGIERRLGCLQPSAEELGLLQAAKLPDVPSSRWVTVTHEQCKAVIEAHLKLFLLDQLTHGSCVGASGVGALQWILNSSGFPPVGKLSLAYLYSWINNNRDGGANIPSALQALMIHGTCLQSTVGVNSIYRSQYNKDVADAEAKRFMLESGATLQGFDAIVSAGQVGHPVQLGVQVDRTQRIFGHFDDEGVVGFVGPGSDHSIFCPPFLVKKRNGGYKVPVINSWGPWGPYGTGWAYLDERHIDGGGGGFIHGICKLDPLNPDQPPKLP